MKNPFELIDLRLSSIEKLLNELKTNYHNKEPAKIQKEFITRQQASKILQVSLPTLSEYTKRGLIPMYRISSKVRYIQHEVEESLKQIKTIKK